MHCFDGADLCIGSHVHSEVTGNMVIVHAKVRKGNQILSF